MNKKPKITIPTTSVFNDYMDSSLKDDNKIINKPVNITPKEENKNKSISVNKEKSTIIKKEKNNIPNINELTTVQVYLDKNIHWDLKTYSHFNKISMTKIITTLIKDFLKKENHY